MTITLRYALLALGLTACGTTDTDATDDTDDSDDTDDTMDTDDTDDTMDTDEEPSTITDIAAGNPDFSTLVSALVRVGLDDTLASDGEFTVFAPTNAAFTALGVDLSTLTDAELTSILLYHVVAGATVDSSSVPAFAASASENAWGNGLTLLFDTSSGVVINGSAEVTTPDIEASNGIIHVIDAVLLPPDVVDIAVNAGFTGLVGAVGAAADIGDATVASVLKRTDKAVTVFAPTNAAFTAIASTVASLTAAQVTTVLTYHVIFGDDPILAGDLSSGNVTMASTEIATVDLTVTPPTIAGKGIVLTDLHATNGVVHVVDGVLIPPSLAP